MHPAVGVRFVHYECSMTPIAAPSRYEIQVTTLDLLDDCPTWCMYSHRTESTPWLDRLLGIRKRWSNSEVVIGPPIYHPVFMNGRVCGDFMSQVQFLNYWRCRTMAVWKVVGPKELIAELDGNSGGRQLPYNGAWSDQQIAEALPVALHLCQHEIPGD